MCVVVLIKGTVDSEAGALPSKELIMAMAAYNDELANAGIMIDGGGFKPTSQGVRVTFDGDSRTVVDDPFGNPNELVAGYWIWQVNDMDEAIEWLKGAPNPMPGPSMVEIRPLYETEDFASVFAE